MQKNIIIKSKDKKFNIYGVLDRKAKTDRVIIFVHGLTGNKNEHQFYNAAKYFNDLGFAAFRFDLYSDKENGRKLEDCAISTHSEDLNQVISYFKNKFSRLFLVGHSLGGPTILGADLKGIEKIVLWDPAVNLPKTAKRKFYYFNKEINAYIVSWGTSFIIGKKMIEDWKHLDLSKWVNNTEVPLKIICAGKGILKEEWKKIIGQFKSKNKLAIIKKAGHSFDEENTEAELFKETLAWFK